MKINRTDNDTETDTFLPSEFKELWNEIVSENL